MVYKNNSLNNTANEDFLVTTATAGADRALRVTNTDNSAAASAAHVQVTVGGTTSTGDPYTNYLVTGGGTFSLGIDNSDSDKLKITTGATPSAGSTAVEVLSDGTVNVLLGNLFTTRSQVGALVQLSVGNTDTGNTSSAARLNISNGGAGAGDTYILFDVNGSAPQSWEMGDDATDGSFNLNFNITPGTANLTGTNAFKVTSNGEVTEPLQPAFLAYRNANLANQTGAGGIADAACDTEVFDQNSDYNTGTFSFTAPVTGRYNLNLTVYLYSLTTAMDQVLILFNSSNRLIWLNYTNSSARAAGDELSSSSSALIDMDAGDIVNAQAIVYNGASNSAGIAGLNGGRLRTFFSGNLEC